MTPRSVTGLALALELTELGAQLQAQRYRREHPGASDADVAQFVRAWMLDRPGAPYGDADGTPGSRFQ